MHKQDCFRGKFKLGIGERLITDSTNESLTESDISSSDREDSDEGFPMVKPSIQILSDQDNINSEEEEEKIVTKNV